MAADFADILGMGLEKQALCAAVAGSHNLLLLGESGSGKSALCSAAASLLPPLTWGQALSRLLLTGSLSRSAPFVSINATTTLAALLGGGRGSPTAGAVSLAHNGCLWLDELPEAPKPLLEALRQPLEDKQITIVRSGREQTFPADFLLLATGNACHCAKAVCVCSAADLARYRRKLSGPILDRIDLVVWSAPLPASLRYSQQSQQIPSAAYRQAVLYARQRQAVRGCLNNLLPAPAVLRNGIGFSPEAYALYQRLTESLSVRSAVRIGRLARTLADLLQTDHIGTEAVQQAYAYNQGKERLA